MEKIFEALIETAPIISKMFDGSAAIAISDKEECLYSLDGINVKASMKIGQKIDNEIARKTGLIDNIYVKKKAYTSILNKETHGIDLKATAIPLFNEKNEVVGWVGLNTNIEEFTRIASSTEELKSSLQETNLTVLEITNSALQLSEKLNRMI